MKLAGSAAFLLSVLILATVRPSFAESTEEIDTRLERELRSESPEAAALFLQANAARTENRHEEAASLYGQVHARVPTFSHAYRREGYELVYLGRREEAIARMRTALSIDSSAWNMVGLASAIVTTQPGQDLSASEIADAVTLARDAERLDSSGASQSFLACRLALLTGNMTWLDASSLRLEMAAPDDPMGPVFRSFALAAQGNLAGAKAKLEHAHTLGLPESMYRDLKENLDPTLKWRRRGILALTVLASWISGFLVLLALGSVLSQFTLRQSSRIPRHESGGAAGMDASLRSAYRWVLGACCLFYFVSIPLLLATVLVTGGGLMYIMVESGHVPVRLFVLVLIATVMTVWAIVKSFFVRGADGDPGLKLDAAAHPKLRRVLDEVAGTIGTRAVTNVYLTPGTEVAVMERGGMLEQLRGATERCLVLGIGAIEGMTMRPFRAVLAHEYGHFSNRDTAGGGFALAVRRSLITTAVHLRQTGAAGWYNPAWWFIQAYYRIFLRVSHGASRLQEVLADRWAAFAYGSEAFAQGLEHIIERTVRFDARTDAMIRESLEARLPLPNLYARSKTTYTDETTLAGTVQAAMSKEPSPYDSHPRPVDRIAWVGALGATGEVPRPDDADEVWGLFEDRESIELGMTREVGRNLKAHGIDIVLA